jgi:hypothetical protein
MKSCNQKVLISFFLFLLPIVGNRAVSQQVPAEQPPANVAGNWTIYSKSDDGKTATQYIQLKQNGTAITGHFKGPHQSGGLEGTMDIRHIVFHTKTREVLTFRGMVDGNSIQGAFGIHGVHGVWQATRTN